MTMRQWRSHVMASDERRVILLKTDNVQRRLDMKWLLTEENWNGRWKQYNDEEMINKTQLKILIISDWWRKKYGCGCQKAKLIWFGRRQWQWRQWQWPIINVKTEILNENPVKKRNENIIIWNYWNAINY